MSRGGHGHPLGPLPLPQRLKSRKKCPAFARRVFCKGCQRIFDNQPSPQWGRQSEPNLNTVCPGPPGTSSNGPTPGIQPQANTKNNRTNPTRSANWFIYSKNAKIAARNEPNLIRLPPPGASKEKRPIIPKFAPVRSRLPQSAATSPNGPVPSQPAAAQYKK
jgi:hypothetical protein